VLLKLKMYKTPPGRKIIDLTGQTFGRWEVLRFVGTGCKPHEARFLCRCQCGTERIVSGEGLRKGTSKSCGCANPGHANLRDANWRRANMPNLKPTVQ
jgi:hypothetical protein